MWVEKNKRNQMISHLLDDAVILIEKLHTVGWRPLLLLQYPRKEAKLISPKNMALSTNAQTCVKNIHEIYKIMVEAITNQATESSQEPEEATVILHLETIVNASTEEQDSTATACLDQEAGTMDPELNLRSPPTGQDLTATSCLDQEAGTMDGPESNLSPPTGQDLTAATCLDQEAGTMDGPESNLIPPTGQDLTATSCLDQEAGTMDGPESNLIPLPTGQDSTANTVMDQEAGTTVDPEQDLNLPPTGQGTRRIRRKKVGTKQKDCPHSNREVHPYKGIIRKRQRKGKTEHLYDWMPCELCGKTWPPTWETA
ncbi:uncharacterized protein [Garra rufa]|uniref:uncharacterized protein n=1 Tax=Garra rufa TaxID=137080 RepID=UPI003CCE577D